MIIKLIRLLLRARNIHITNLKSGLVVNHFNRGQVLKGHTERSAEIKITHLNYTACFMSFALIYLSCLIEYDYAVQSKKMISLSPI